MAGAGTHKLSELWEEYAGLTQSVTGHARALAVAGAVAVWAVKPSSETKLPELLAFALVGFAITLMLDWIQYIRQASRMRRFLQDEESKIEAETGVADQSAMVTWQKSIDDAAFRLWRMKPIPAFVGFVLIGIYIF